MMPSLDDDQTIPTTAGRLTTTTLTSDPFSILQAVTACGVLVWEATDEEIIAANQTAAEMLALPLRELLRPGVLQQRIRLLHPDGTPLAWEEWPAAVALRTGQAQQQVPLGVAFPDGQCRFLRVDVVPVRWRQDEALVRWVVVSFTVASDPGHVHERTRDAVPGA